MSRGTHLIQWSSHSLYSGITEGDAGPALWSWRAFNIAYNKDKVWLELATRLLDHQTDEYQLMNHDQIYGDWAKTLYQCLPVQMTVVLAQRSHVVRSPELCLSPWTWLVSARSPRACRLLSAVNTDHTGSPGFPEEIISSSFEKEK